MTEEEQLAFLRRQKMQLVTMATLHRRGAAAEELLALIPPLQARIDMLEAQRRRGP